jgi:hypothetical protein
MKCQAARPDPKGSGVSDQEGKWSKKKPLFYEGLLKSSSVGIQVGVADF